MARDAKEYADVLIDQNVIREVLARTDIGTFIGDYVALRKRGNDLVGLCPFHGEKTPSLHVHPGRGFFKCFGCGAGGSAITFFEKIENVRFPDAVRALAKRVGVEVEPETATAARIRSEKEMIYAANELAAAYFHRMLRRDPAAARARAYCAQRDLSDATVDAFVLGFAPDGWDGLTVELRRAGVDPALAVRAGLLKAGQHGYYDFYRGRLMIPTYATTGEVIAFGGRALGDVEPKYLNTGTTAVYTKGRGLFALNVARRAVAKTESLIVVEGYLDCIALHQSGFINTVASLGTAFTSDQAAELRKYTDRVFICFDSDAAGSAATVKSIDLLLTAGCAARIVKLPAGEDPDSFVRTHGRDAFARLLDAAVSAVEFKLERSLDTIRTRFVAPSAVAREAERLVRSLPREEWDKWRVYVAGRLGLSIEDVRASAFRADAANFAPAGLRAPPFGRHAAPLAEPLGIERDILMTLLEEPALVAEYADRIPATAFANETLGSVYAVLVQRRTDLLEPADVFSVFGEDRRMLEAIVGLQPGEPANAMRFRSAEQRRAHLDRIIERLGEEADKLRLREIDERISAGGPVPQAERDEYRSLVERVEHAARKRLGAKV